jgi:uncharacterized protein (DUF433 family)
VSKKPDSVKLLPAYPLAAVARFVGSNPSTLRGWFRGRSYEVNSEKRRSEPVLQTRSGPGEPLSFIDLVEAHVFLLIRKRYRIPQRNIKAAREHLKRLKGGMAFLACKDFCVDSRQLYLELDGRLISLSERGQVVDREIISKGLKQLSYGSDGYASEFFPSIDGKAQDSVMLSPTQNFGRLCIAKSGVSADIIAVRFVHGEKISDIAEDYAVSPDEVEEAIRWHNRLSACDDRLAA